MTLKKKTIYFEYAYYKGRSVIVPFFYVPEEAIVNGYAHRFQFIPVDGTLIEPLPRRDSTAAYERMAREARETILPYRLSNSDLKELCTINDIPLKWVTNQYKSYIPSEETKKRLTRRLKRKCTPLDPKSYKKFIKELCCISKKSVVIAEILWFLNSQMEQGNDYITIEEILRLRIDDVTPDDGLYFCITLNRSTSRGTHMVTHWLPESIWESLCKTIRNDYLYVFSTKKGIPLLPQNVSRNFKIAGKRAGIREDVTSLSLRPRRNMDYEIKNRVLKEISIEEWEILCNCVPDLKPKRGTRKKYDQRMIFNGILYHHREKKSLSKLPPIYPPEDAIESQYRRWKKNGVYESVLEARR